MRAARAWTVAALAMLTRPLKAGFVRSCLVACSISAGACSAPPPVASTDLAYPVLVLFPQSGGVRHDDPADLGVMSVQRVMGADGPVVLIDSRLDIYRLDKLESEHSGLWLMAHPNDRTGVRFELRLMGREDIAQARRLILERESSVRAGGEPGLRGALLQATTLQTLLQIIGK